MRIAKNENEIAFLIGNGPSLNEVNISKLKDKVTISFNRAYIAYNDWGFDPTFYMCTDGKDVRSNYIDIATLIKDSKIEEFFICKAFENIKIDECENIKKTDNVHFIDNYDPDFWNNAECGFSVAYTAVAMLYMRGFRRIALLGCDCVYKDSNPSREQREGTESGSINHFRKDYYKPGVFYGAPPLDQNMYPRIWKAMSYHIETQQIGLKIYSCSKNGVLNSTFEYVEFEKLVNE